MAIRHIRKQSYFFYVNSHFNLKMIYLWRFFSSIVYLAYILKMDVISFLLYFFTICFLQFIFVGIFFFFFFFFFLIQKCFVKYKNIIKGGLEGDGHSLVASLSKVVRTTTVSCTELLQNHTDYRERWRKLPCQILVKAFSRYANFCDFNFPLTVSSSQNWLKSWKCILYKLFLFLWWWIAYEAHFCLETLSTKSFRIFTFSIPS